MAQRVKCPRCDAMNPLQAVTVQGRIWTEYGDTITFKDAKYLVETGGDAGDIAVIDCGGCGKNFVVEHGYPPEVLWPLPGANVSEDLPVRVAEAYKDARLSLAAGSKIGALMAGRTTLIRVLRNKEASSFKDLVAKGILTDPLYGGADQLRLWADIIGHEDISIDDFTQQEVEDVLNYLGVVLEAAYVHQAKVDRFVERTKKLKDKGGD